MRLDKYLQINNYTVSRNSAQELIKNRKIKVAGKIITKSSFQIESQEIEILEDIIYVSRAAYKLKSFFDDHNLNVNEKNCLDIGSSTGGFVQILCEYGANLVTAVDVGRNQLSSILKNEPKIISFEGLNIRDFKSDFCFDFVTCDVSFVVINYILKDIDRLSKDEIIILFKPQFEVGREVKRDKKGVVKDSKAIILETQNFEKKIELLGWNLICKEYSKIKGKEGNEEIFYYFKK